MGGRFLIFMFMFALCSLLISCQEEEFKTAIMDMNIHDGKLCPEFFSLNIETGRCERDMHVFGQTTFRRKMVNATHATANGFYSPGSVIKIGGKFVVADSGNNRVLIFDADDDSDATVVLGQQDFTSDYANADLDAPTASTLRYPKTLATDGTKLIVGDSSNKRVLIWNTLPTENFTPADVVIGQPDFSTAEGECDQSSLKNAYSMHIIGGRLYVLDTSNHRVMVWNSIPTTSGASADFVVGQSDFTSCDANGGSTTSSLTLDNPIGMGTDGTKLFVADTKNNRVLIWNTAPTTSGVPADVVVGQTDMTSNGMGSGMGQFMYAWNVFSTGGALYASDYMNRRVLYFDTIPTTNGVEATRRVLNYVSSPSLNGISYPLGNFYVDGTTMYYTDYPYYRILKYDPVATATDTVANAVWGQGNGSETTAYINNQRPTRNGFYTVSCVGTDSDYMVASSRYHSRLLVFDKNADDNDKDAIAVIGHDTFDEGHAVGTWAACDPTATATNFCNVEACHVAPTGRLYVGDRYQNRVLVYNNIPTTSGASPDYVIGQPNFTTKGSGTSSITLSQPFNAVECGGYLWVGDKGNSRVLRYDLPITQNQPAANLVIGQDDFTTNTGGPSQTKFGAGMNMGLTCDHANGRLLTIEYGPPARILIFDPLPTTNGEAAKYVLGQQDFTSTVSETSRVGMKDGNQCSHGAFVGGYFFVADRQNSRIMVWNLNGKITNGMPASHQFGQPDFSTMSYDGFSVSKEFGTNWIYSPYAVFADYDKKYVWFADGSGHRVIRIKRNVLWKYMKTE